MNESITLGQFSCGEFEATDFDMEVVVIDDEVNDGERSAILMEPLYCCIPDLGVKVANGTMSYWNSDEEFWDSDFSLTLVYAIDSDKPQDYIFWEQDKAEITLWNWLRGSGKLDEERFKGLDDLAKLPAYIA